MRMEFGLCKDWVSTIKYIPRSEHVGDPSTIARNLENSPDSVEGGRRKDANSRLLGMDLFKFIGGSRPDLDKTAFMEMDYGTVSFQCSLIS